MTRDQFKADLKNKIKEQVKDMVYQLNQSSVTTVIYEKEKPVNYQFEYTVEMIDWNEPESASWDYNSMGNLGWELCNVELNTRTNFTTATFKREIHDDSLYRKFEYTVKTRYWSNKLESDVWTYEEMGKEHW